MINKDLPFDEALGEDDYGLIISKTGELKGVWIPSSAEDEEIPAVVVELCMHFFDLNPNDDSDTLNTLH